MTEGAITKQAAPTPEHRFIERMRQERQDRGWSQEQLVRKVELATGYRLSTTVITKLEWALIPERSDKARGLSLDEAEAIARTFGRTVQSMINSPETDHSGPTWETASEAFSSWLRIKERTAELTAELQDQQQYMDRLIGEVQAIIGHVREGEK